ncbi:hypothetical protein [Polyangium mundeleinium]|uniref:Uncharacterized protein n=1 Tax=Polyangium mundeleinium TaxID=2995306 RepID=A0ABT5EX82_9BACT|nr:hypothetical protein [Polyangium mundeleinium]MDC0746432.1 hypothetical protein [Polyangium mundeleinium]
MIRSILLAASVAAGFLVTARDVAANAQLSSIYAAQGNGGNLQVIGIGKADALPYLADWQYSGDGSWHPGFALPSPNVRLLPSLAVAPGNGGNLQVVGLGANNLPYLSSWQHSSNGTWEPGFLLPSQGTPLSSIAVAQGNSGNLQVIGLGKNDGLPYLASWQNSDGTWHSGFALPSTGVRLSSITVAPGNGGNLQVIGIDAISNLAYLASWQSSSDGSWHAGFPLP